MKKSLASLNRELHTTIRHECQWCDKWFTRKDALKQHIENNHEDGEYPCDECSMVCTSNTRLYNHKYRIHRKPEMEKNIECDQCDKKFFNKSELLTHIRSDISNQY